MKVSTFFLIAIIMVNTVEAMKSSSSSALFYYGLGNVHCHQKREKQECVVPDEIKACVSAVELPLSVELMKNLWKSFSDEVPGCMPDTFEYQRYSLEEQWKKWVLFVRECDKNFEKRISLELLCHWQQEVRKNNFYWLSKQTIARNLMNHLWLEMKNGTAEIGFMSNNTYGPVLEDKEGLLTQFILGLQVGVVENLWKNKKIVVENGCVIQVAENYNNLQIGQVLSICGIKGKSNLYN
jgi:hypothetical protein